jgi:hypothetical protein
MLLYNKNLEDGEGNQLRVIDLEEEGPTNDALSKRTRGHKSTKADLQCDAFVLYISETLKGVDS